MRIWNALVQASVVAFRRNMKQRVRIVEPEVHRDLVISMMPYAGNSRGTGRQHIKYGQVGFRREIFLNGFGQLPAQITLPKLSAAIFRPCFLPSFFLA